MYKRSFKDYFERNRKTLYMVLGILLVSTLSLTVVYAALSVTLNITGSTEVTASNWNIHLANPEVKSGSVNSNVPTISGNNLSFSANLVMPGDYYEFTVDVVNDGSIDAMIDSVVKTPELTTEQAKYIKYEVSYENGESISTNQTIKSGTSTPIKVRIEYRTDISSSDLPSSTTVLDLKLSLIYVQSDGSGSEILNNGITADITIVSGDGTQLGNEICISDECFYVLSSDDTTITILAKYNLYVGNELDDEYTPVPLASPTGKQHSTALGWNTSVKVKGTTSFSIDSNKYNGSIAENYVNNYNSYLITQGVTPIEARLITKEELINFGCVVSDYCSSETPKWIYSTTYWTMTSWTKGEVYALWNDSVLNHMDETIDDIFGIRPVIVISKTLLNIAYNSSEVKELIEFTIDGIKYQAEEGMTWGDWIDSEYNTGGFLFSEYGFVSDGEYLLLQCADSSSSINKNASYSIFRGAMVCDSDDW